MRNSAVLKPLACEGFADQGCGVDAGLRGVVWMTEDKLFIRVPETIEEDFYACVSTIMLDMILSKNDMDIVLLIDSYGGDLNATMDTYNLLSSVDNKIITLAFNKCCSAACILFALGEERYFLRDTTYILHQVRAYIQTESQMMQTSEVKKFANNFENSQNEYKRIIKKKTKIPTDKLNEIFNSLEDTKFKTDEIAKYAIATKIFKKFSEVPL